MFKTFGLSSGEFSEELGKGIKGYVLCYRSTVRKYILGQGKRGKGIEIVAESIATTLSVLIPVLDPDRVILGGYAVRISELLIPRLKYHLERKNKNMSTFTLDTSPLDTDAALFGGYISAQEELFNDPHSIS